MSVLQGRGLWVDGDHGLLGGRARQSQKQQEHAPDRRSQLRDATSVNEDLGAAPRFGGGEVREFLLNTRRGWKAASR